MTVSGYHRSRAMKGLTTCSDLWVEALHTTHDLRFLMQVEAFYKKNVAFADADALVTPTLEAFWANDEWCAKVNSRFDYLCAEPERIPPDFSLMISRSQEYVGRVLGEYQNFLEDLPRRVRLTAGATSTRSRAQAIPHLKVTKKPVCTAGAVPYLQALSKQMGYGALQPRVRQWNRVEQVPKNWKINRTIACEPEGNIPLQLAFDSYAKDRLRKFGIDLSSQLRNQELAKAASINGEFATVDLSAASDTVSYNVVALLFPYNFWEFLVNVRTPFGRVDGKLVKYHKFSSMGNGTTFPIETLIFASACYAVGSKQFSVYGDDIVIETELFPALQRYMEFLGFKLNTEKTYSTGPFRESCGVNCVNGIDITPFYIRDLDSRKAVLSHVCNGLKSICVQGGLVEDLIYSVINAYDLAPTAYTEDTMAGILVDPTTAYELGILKMRRHRAPGPDFQVPECKRYVRKTTRRYVYDSRALFLWHLDAATTEKLPGIAVRRDRKGLHLEVVEARERSWHSEPLHVYKRKWASWYPPASGMPSWCYNWDVSRLARKG